MKNLMMMAMVFTFVACGEKNSKSSPASAPIPVPENNRQTTDAGTRNDPVVMSAEVTATALVNVNRIFIQQTVRNGNVQNGKACQIELRHGETLWVQRTGNIMQLTYQDQTVQYAQVHGLENQWINLMIHDGRREQITTTLTITENQISVKKNCLFHN